MLAVVVGTDVVVERKLPVHVMVVTGFESSASSGMIDTESTDTEPNVVGSASVPNPRWWIVTEP